MSEGPSEQLVKGSSIDGPDDPANTETTSVVEAEVPVGPVADPDQAWKALSLVNDWIKHAEAKVGATLAASGAVGTMLYNLVRGSKGAPCYLTLLIVLCGASIIAVVVSATIALLPRLSIAKKPKKESTDDLDQDPVNLLFFSTVARRFAGDGPTYVEVLHSLTSDREELTRQIAHQVHANATVAHRKFQWANRAIFALIAALLFLGAVAVIIGDKG